MPAVKPIPLLETDELSKLARQINEEHRDAEVAYRIARAANVKRSGHAIKAGRLLLQAKEQVPHGKWRVWLAANCEVSVRVAQEYMQLGRRYAEKDTPKARRAAHLSIREALKELREPANLVPVRVVADVPPPKQTAVIEVRRSGPPTDPTSVVVQLLSESDTALLSFLRQAGKTDSATIARVSRLDDTINLEELAALFADAAVQAME